MLFKTLLHPPHILGKNRKRSNKVKVITEVIILQAIAKVHVILLDLLWVNKLNLF